MEDRAPDCRTARAASVAGILAAAVMAGEMSMHDRTPPPSIIDRLASVLGKVGHDDVLQSATDFREGYRTASLMIEARARASVRTPSHASLSAAEAALALAEDWLDDRIGEHADLTDVHVVIASISATLRDGLNPLHAAEGLSPAGP